MLKIYQEPYQCFTTAVACITEIPVHELPFVLPTWIPEDVYGVWSDWGREHGLRMHYTEVEPKGLCIAQLNVLDAQEILDIIGGDSILHSVVWKDGDIVWNPERKMDFELGEPDSFVVIN